MSCPNLIPRMRSLKSKTVTHGHPPQKMGGFWMIAIHPTVSKHLRNINLSQRRGQVSQRKMLCPTPAASQCFYHFTELLPHLPCFLGICRLCVLITYYQCFLPNMKKQQELPTHKTLLKSITIFCGIDNIL
jgi:hypothetical protein